MTMTPQQLKEFAKRFAALFSGFDLGNASENEAMAKGLAMRRMAAQVGTRIIDLLQLDEVREAIEIQMQPIKAENRELQEALEQAAALREELTERMRDVRNLAELLQREKQTAEQLRQQVAAARPAAWQSPPQPQHAQQPHAQPQHWPQQQVQ